MPTFISLSTTLIPAIAVIVILILNVPIAIILAKWQTIKFWMFVRFGIKFKDEDEVEDLKKMDYDGFVNYT